MTSRESTYKLPLEDIQKFKRVPSRVQKPRDGIREIGGMRGLRVDRGVKVLWRCFHGEGTGHWTFLKEVYHMTPLVTECSK